MSGPTLSVGRGVIVEMARLAALEVPEVLRVARGGPRWRAMLVGPAIRVRVRGDEVSLRLWLIARPGADLTALGTGVRAAVGAAVERLLALRASLTHVRSALATVLGAALRPVHLSARSVPCHQTASAAFVPGVASPFRPCSKRSSASAPRPRSSNAS